jgi:hypothetical protein
MKLTNRRVVSVSALAVLMSALFSSRAEAQDPSRSIEGTWFVQLTFRNCDTGAVLGSGFGLNTFVPGGTMLGTPNAPPAAIRTGHGVWTHVAGTRFFNRMGLFNYNPQTGAFAGIRVVTRNIELGPGPDQFTSRDTDQLYDPATFAPIGGPGCVTGVGRRVP